MELFSHIFKMGAIKSLSMFLHDTFYSTKTTCGFSCLSIELRKVNNYYFLGLGMLLRLPGRLARFEAVILSVHLLPSLPPTLRISSP